MNKNKMDKIYSFLGMVGDWKEPDRTDLGSCVILHFRSVN
jgi:hypothetical protein